MEGLLCLLNNFILLKMILRQKVTALEQVLFLNKALQQEIQRRDIEMKRLHRQYFMGVSRYEGFVNKYRVEV